MPKEFDPKKVHVEVNGVKCFPHEASILCSHIKIYICVHVNKDGEMSVEATPTPLYSKYCPECGEKL